MRNAHPAITQTVPRPGVTRRYEPIVTSELIAQLRPRGWRVRAITVAAPRKADPGFAQHRVAFRHDRGHLLSGGVEPELLVLNSHDGATRARAMMGLWREDSATTLIVGAPEFYAETRHSTAAAETLAHAAAVLGDKFHAVEEVIDAWKGRTLTAAEQVEFARLAGQLRYGDGWTYEPEVLLAARRPTDAGATLWAVTARLQENLVLGGFQGRALSGQQVTALPLTGIERDANFNVDLWKLAGEML